MPTYSSNPYKRTTPANDSSRNSNGGYRNSGYGSNYNYNSSRNNSGSGNSGNGGNNGRSGNNGNRNNNRKKKKRKLKVLPTIIAVILLIFVICAIGVAIYVLNIAKDLPEIDPAHFTPSESSHIFTGDGVEYAVLSGGENRTRVSSSDIPQHLKDVVVATEDIRFYDHFGVDIRRVFGALIADITSGSFEQGASTITMQLARNAILDTQVKEIERKVREALLAIQLEQQYSKDEILTFYLNEVFFGHNVYGVQAAAEFYFGKDVQDLTLGESAMLAGMLRSPNTYSPYKDIEKATYIRDVALNNLLKYKPEYEEQIEQAKAEELVVADGQTSDVYTGDYAYPWYTDYVLDETADILDSLGLPNDMMYTGGLKIYTSLDTKTQAKLEELYADESNFPSSSTGDLVESAAIFMENDTGRIIALVGGREYTTQRGFNRATDLVRQPGSTIKPIAVYGPAVENGLSPASVTNDIPTAFSSTYSPTNYDGRWRGITSMRTAIMNSINVPAVNTLKQIGTKTGYDFAVRLGLPLQESDDNLALALGGISTGVAPIHMVGAYAAFANQGVYTEPHCVDKILDRNGKVIYEANPRREQVMSEQTAYLITDMLVSVTTSGTGTNARMNRPVASKTGTTQLPDKPEFANKRGNKDAWFAAYTPELTGVVWMGYDNEKDEDGNLQYLRQIYGGKYPALIWKNTMTTALEDVEVSSFTRPSGIVSVSIDTKSGLLPSELTPAEYIKSELFNSQYVPTEVSDVWQNVEICADTNQLASIYCPNKVSKVMLKRPEGVDESSLSRAEDYALYTPATTCEMHTTDQGYTTPVTICTDPRHNGQVYLANIPDANSSGGCPAEYQEVRYYGYAYLPTEYCNLSEHAVSGSTIVGPGNNPNSGNQGDSPSYNPNSNDANTPTNFTGSASGNSAMLSWAENNDPENTLYIIERTQNGNSSTTTQLSTYGTHYEDVNLDSGTYTYRVQAYNMISSRTSAWSSSISITIP